MNCSLTLEGRFHIHLLEGESFSELILNLSLTHVGTSMILFEFEVHHGPV